MRHLQYQHLECSLQRDPKGGPPRIVLEITYEFAKSYFGVTQGNTFIIPETLYDPSLILRPHEFLLGILFDDDAFHAPGIKSMEDLRRLWPENGRQHTERRRIIRDQPISSAILSKQYKTFGEITGFPNLYTHSNRYGGGTILNQSSVVSDAQQNLIMKHANIRTFLKHYLPLRIGTDIQALMRGLEPDSAMMRAVTRMGRWIDTRRPRELTDHQKASVEEIAELQDAIRKRDMFSCKLQQTYKRRRKDKAKLEKLKRNVINTRNRLLYDPRKRVREGFDSSQAVKDIERQLAKGAVAYDDQTKEMLRVRENMLPAADLSLRKVDDMADFWLSGSRVEAKK
ncbi:hypothetical protein N7478_010259 [Penicillium angulare]|uniref:uncharacterized protein n=1 Tax=Penicillium angulare TaxID=116970 RepID=UPI002540FF2B|nr:uncharacterized protein N7478_010259 [Penicillium angulare]KAJ5267451.1 hypothetical protein N7478_010259 [Penicillium angulare]